MNATFSPISHPAQMPATTARVLPVVTPGGFTRLPLLIVLGYVFATFALFLLWPINWPIYLASDWARLISYVLVCFALIGGATLLGSAGATAVVGPLPLMRWIVLGGAAISAALLEPSSVAYTGRTIWEIGAALRDQGGEYHRLQLQLATTAGQRNTFVIIRALTSPLTYAVLPLGVVRWRLIGWSGRIAVLVAAGCSMIFSVMRGTYGRNRTLGVQGFALVRRYWRVALVALIFFSFAQGLFTTRKSERLGGNVVSRAAVCANDSRICANLDNAWIAWLPQQQRFGLTFFILSTCSGYYGLELALEKPFEPSWGVGHSPAALSIYEAATGDRAPHLRTFTYRNGEDHWSEDNYWSTLVTWIANDVGFLGALPILAGIAWLWGRWWREASAGMSDPAAVLFSVGTMMMVYLPANNQVLASYDGYVVVLCWTLVWLWHRLRQRVFARVQPA
jgi:hypothetical protein